MNSLNDNLVYYIMDPKNPLYNFHLGKSYEDQGHAAAAAGFYLRTAEYSDSDLLCYEALLRMALCFNRQGSRVFTVKGVLLRAISLMPERPEAYFLLSRTYEVNRDWQEAYTWAIVGGKLEKVNFNQKLLTNVEYPGPYGFIFERAVAAWWIGLYSESLHLFRKLRKNPKVSYDHMLSVTQNLENLSDVWQEPLEYDQSMYERLRVKFKGSRDILKNYSQFYQDFFVLTMLNGKKHGSYLEIGCGDPFYGNNTALLEKEFNWEGTSVDISKDVIDKFKKARNSSTINKDATKIDYEKVLKGRDVDYLQIDCDPALTSLQVLFQIPFESHRFAVITFEHDHYLDETDSIRDRSRSYLESLGYELIIGDVAMNKFNSLEDWWIHSELVDDKIIKKFIHCDNIPNRIEDCLFSKY